MVYDKYGLQKDGSLFNGGWYLAWDIEMKEATLDGDFTAEELIYIANHMKKNYRP